MLVASLDFGVTTDEQLRQLHGEAVVRYYTSGLRDRSAIEEPGAGVLHGGLFDVACVVFQDVLPGDDYMIRHFVNAVFGWLGIWISGLVASRAFGRTGAGLLGMVLLAISPHYFAASMNNPKDLPFAAMTMVALYFLLNVSSRPPYLSWRLVAILGVAVALAINVRSGGILYIGYLGLLTLTLAARSRDRSLRNVISPLLRVGVVAVLSLVLGTIFWPWAQQQPFVRPIVGLVVLSRFPFYTGQALLNGRHFLATSAPASYLPEYFAVTTPPVVLIGAMLSLLLIRTDRKWAIGGLWFVTLFPVVSGMVRGSTEYHGIRHMLFIYPPLVVLGAGGWIALLEWFNTISWKLVVVAMLGVGIAEPVSFQFRNHPNQGVYYNVLVGGPSGAGGRYDLDYWRNSLFQAVNWVSTLSTDPRHPILIAGEPTFIVRADAARFPTVAFVPLGARLHHLQVKSLPSLSAKSGPIEGGLLSVDGNDRLVVKVIRTADRTPLCVVLSGPQYDEIAGRLHISSGPTRKNRPNHEKKHKTRQRVSPAARGTVRIGRPNAELTPKPDGNSTLETSSEDPPSGPGE